MPVKYCPYTYFLLIKGLNALSPFVISAVLTYRNIAVTADFRSVDE